MPTDHEPENVPHDPLAKMGYELEDIEYKGLGRSIGWFFLFVAFCGAAGFIIFGFSIGWDKILEETPATAPFVKRIPSDPNPLLQTNVTARTDIRDLRRAENALLHGKPTYIDKDKGIVRIPVEKAIDMYSRQMANAPTTATTTTRPAETTTH